MCSCDWNHVCPRHVGTPHDPAYFDTPGPSELEQERHEKLISRPDFRQPIEVAR